MVRKIRSGVFETNSSSTHSLTITKPIDNYTEIGNKLKIKFIDTDEETLLTTLEEKVSYLVSHIISWYRYSSSDYDDLIFQVKENYDFRKIERFVKQKYGKEIIFPKEYDGDIEEIVNINHQLTSWNKNLNEILEDIISEESLLDEVLNNGNSIVFGRG